MNKLKQVINYGQKSYIPEGKKKISSCTFVYLYVCLSENQTKRQMLSLLTRPFFFWPRTGSLSDGWGGFSRALNSANRYLMYDIKLIYENKTGVHTYFFSGLNICDCFWFGFVSFRFFFFFFTLYHFSFYSLE